MNSLSFASCLLLPSTFQQPPHYNRCKAHSNYLRKFSHNVNSLTGSLTGLSIKLHPLYARQSLACAMDPPPEEGVVAVMSFEELAEKDWSILESDSTDSKENLDKINQVIGAGNVMETSRVLVSLGSDAFVDRLVDSSPCEFFLIVHDSLLSLACIKERYDEIKCWQGELIYVPEKWSPFDVVFLCLLPALPFKLEEIFEALSSRCSPGARVVISHLQGRPALEQQRQQYPDIVVSDLPNKSHLETVASDHSFMLKEYVDNSGFYLAVLEFKA